MPKFSTSSKLKLLTCHKDLQDVANAAIEIVDFAVTEGYRDQATQDKYFAEGKSKTPFPESKHNSQPAQAFDFVPSPFNYQDLESDADIKVQIRGWMRLSFLAGVFVGIAAARGVKLRWGADWNRNGDPGDDKFRDAVHIERDEK